MLIKKGSIYREVSEKEAQRFLSSGYEVAEEEGKPVKNSAKRAGKEEK